MAASLDTRPATALEDAAELWDDPIEMSYEGDAFSVREQSAQSAELTRTAESAGLVLPGGEFQHVDRGTGIVQQSINTSQLSVDWVIVTRDKERNRNGNMVQIKEGGGHKGLDLSFHMQSPVVLFNHGFPDPNPIALTKIPESGKYTIRTQARRAVATTYFVRRKTSDPESDIERDFITETAERTFALIEAGAINANSIGFIPLLARRLSGADLARSSEDGVENMQWFGGWDFVHSELIEDSIVITGADRGALRQCLDRGNVNGVRLGGDYAKVLRLYIGETPVQQGWHPNRDQIQMQSSTPASAEFSLANGTTARISASAADIAAITQAIGGGIVGRPSSEPQMQAAHATHPEQTAASVVQTMPDPRAAEDAIIDQFAADAISAGHAVAMESLIERVVQETLSPVVDQFVQCGEQATRTMHEIAKRQKRDAGEF